MIVERFQVCQLPDKFAGSPEHVVFQFVLFIEAEAHTRLGFCEQVRDILRKDSRKFTFGPVIDERAVVDQYVIRRAAVAEFVLVPGQFDKVG